MSLELNIAVCDDEKYYREYIQKLVSEYLNQMEGILYHIQTFKDGFDFCKEESNFKNYDIIFFDIEMKKKNGMDTAYEIRKRNRQMDIIFITVMSDYVFEGYKVKAERYILKDDLDNELADCLQFILKRRCFDEKRMEFPFVRGTRSILLKDLLYIESRSHKIVFVRQEESLYMYGQIDDIEEKLSRYNFVRCHQSYLVNLQYVDKIIHYRIYLSNGTEIPVSRPRYIHVRDSFLMYKEI